jgi:hypothetical protein
MLSPSTIEDSDMESLELSENEGETMKEEATGGRKGSPQPCRTTQLRSNGLAVNPWAAGIMFGAVRGCSIWAGLLTSMFRGGSLHSEAADGSARRWGSRQRPRPSWGYHSWLQEKMKDRVRDQASFWHSRFFDICNSLYKFRVYT